MNSALRQKLPLLPLRILLVLNLAGSVWAQEAADSPRLATNVLKLQIADKSAAAAKGGRNAASSGPVEKAPGKIGHAKAGPWGEIEFCTTYLEAPEELLQATSISSLALDWRFVGFADADVETLFASVELPAALRGELLDRAHWRREGETAIVTPPAPVLEALPTEARARIYAVLARWTANRFHFEPSIVPRGEVQEWLRGGELRPPILEAIRKTCYRRGQTTLFSDTALVLRLAETDAERTQIRKALSRTPSLVATVNVGPESNLAVLTDYWTCGRRFTDIVPFLETAVENEGLVRVDIMHLLPAAVRKILYTFPNASHGRSGYFPDCHWTALNFFNYEPLERLAEPPLATAYALENYARVPKADRLGDVLFLMDEKGNTYHSCVYIADDIVFTKNGRSATQPWVLMKLGDVQELYAIYQKTQTVAWRQKTLQ